MKREPATSNLDTYDLRLIRNRIPELKPLVEKYRLDLLVLLGSYGTEHFEPSRSDIDIAFLSKKNLQSEDYLQLMGDFSTFFQYDRLDLIDLRGASGLLKYEIADKGRLLFQSKDGFFERYRLYCLRYYYDTAKFRALRKDFFQEQLEALRDA